MSDYTLESAVERYVLYAGAKGYSAKTVTHVVRSVRTFCHYVNRDDPLTVTAEDLQRFIVFLREKKAWSGTPHAKDRPLSATSINTYVRGIRSFWSWMLSQKMIDSNPLVGVSAPKLPKRLPKIFTEDEVRAIRQTVSLEPLNEAMILVLVDSGVRLSELVGLTLGSIYLNRCRLRVIGKGGKDRIAYFSDITADVLAAYLSQREKTQYEGNLNRQKSFRERACLLNLPVR